ncbi:MAG: hypothetical protein ACR2NZ_24245 [Rubripirellula sp.]
MNQPEPPDAEMTLDPPGSIAIVGAGPLGLEAALYGRFLGYDVVVLEAGVIGQNLYPLFSEVPPVLPDQCLSALAQSALAAQLEADPSASLTLPTTVEQWVQLGLEPLAQTDLLRGRVFASTRITMIQPIVVEADEVGEDTTDLPSDFQLTSADDDGADENRRVEAVILATGNQCDIDVKLESSCPYFFRIGGTGAANDVDLLEGRRQIAGIFAQLAGRSDLDLYRPRRV